MEKDPVCKMEVDLGTAKEKMECKGKTIISISRIAARSLSEI
jgi:hypothetical protein